MGRPQINGQISVGNIITFTVMLVGFAANFGFLQSQIAQAQKSVERLDLEVSEEVRERRAEDIRMADRVRIVENIQARNDERFVAVLDALERIDGRLNRVLQNIEGQQR